MSDLGVEDEVTDQVVLADQGGGVLAKVVEDFHDLVGLHYFFESIIERINGLQVYNEAFVRKIDLNKLHAAVFREALAVHAKNGCALRLDHVHDSLRELGHLPRRSDNINAGGKSLIRTQKLLGHLYDLLLSNFLLWIVSLLLATGALLLEV